MGPVLHHIKLAVSIILHVKLQIKFCLLFPLREFACAGAAALSLLRACACVSLHGTLFWDHPTKVANLVKTRGLPMKS